jgi:hypothetical protein
MSDPKRQALLRSMERDGQKDRIDVVELDEGRFQVIEGHGRVGAAAVLGWETVAAKVFETDPKQPDQRVLIRQRIFEANDAVMKMSGAQWAQFIYLEGRATAGQDVKAMSKAVDLVDFILTNLPKEAEDLIMVKNVGPDSLAAARRAVREIDGLPVRGPIPQDAVPHLAEIFKWVVKHGMTRPVVDWLKEGKGHSTVSECIHEDEPLPGSTGRGKPRRRAAAEVSEREAED